MNDNSFDVELLDATIIDNYADEAQPVIELSVPTSWPEIELLNSDDGNELLSEVSDHNADITVNIVGEGPVGPRGYDTYEIWLSLGNTGTREEFINSGLSYVHPEKHSPSIIEETNEKQFISLADKLKLSGYIHDQIASSKRWLVYHTLDKSPSVSVVDTGGNLVVGDVEYISKSQLIITFSAEFSGKAYLN